MTTPLRNSNPISLRLASLAGAALLCAFVFLVFPLSNALSAKPQARAEAPQKKLFASIRAPQKQAFSKREDARALRAKPQANPVSAQKVEAQIPASGYGSLEIASAGADVDFGMESFGQRAENLEGFGVRSFEFSELDSVPKCLKRGALQYPRRLFERGVEGEVRLSVFINENGTVELDKVESFTREEFLQAAQNNLKNMRYEPPVRGGEPVRARFVLPVNFKIKK